MEPHRLPQSVFAWGPAAAAVVVTEARVHSTSHPLIPSSSPGPRLSAHISASSSPKSPLARPDSYPRSAAASPAHFHGGSHQRTSSSYPVFPAHAQQQFRSNNNHNNSSSSSSAASSPRPLREAVLHTKNPLAAVSAASASPANTIKPKMHLYAADRKPRATAPRDEEFPDVPVEWLVGSPGPTPSDGSSVSLSELQSGDISEDDAESLSSGFKSGSSSSSTPVLRDADEPPCHFLSVGLKALLKVQA